MGTPNPSPSAIGVAVTSLGAVTASGTSVAALFDDMLSGRRPFTTKEIPLVAIAAPGAQTQGAGTKVRAAHVQASLDLTDAVGARADRSFGRDSRLLLYAMRTTGAALRAESDAATDRTGVVLGTLYAGRNEYLAIHDAPSGTSGPVNPVWGPQSGYNAPAAQLSIHLPARGPNLTLSSGATAGLDAVVTGVQQVAAGVCDHVVVAGLDTLCAAVNASDEARGSCATEPTDVPGGEAAAVLVLKDATHEGERVLARVVGTGQAATAPAAGLDEQRTAHGLAAAAVEAVRAALSRAGRQAAEVGLAVTTSCADRASGEAERAALTAVFGQELPMCNATATTGRAGGADGVIAVAVAIEALARGVVPSAAGPGPRPVDSARPLALCLSVERGGTTTAVLVGDVAAGRGAAA